MYSDLREHPIEHNNNMLNAVDLFIRPYLQEQFCINNDCATIIFSYYTECTHYFNHQIHCAEYSKYKTTCVINVPPWNILHVRRTYNLLKCVEKNIYLRRGIPDWARKDFVSERSYKQTCGSNYQRQRIVSLNA